MGESATPVGNAKTCRPSGLYTGTGRHEHTEGSKEPGGHWAPRPGNGKPGKAQRLPAGVLFLHSRLTIWASCFERVACLLSERKSLPSPYPAPTIPPAQPSPPVIVLLLLTIQHPAGSPAAPSCTKDAREAPARPTAVQCCAVPACVSAIVQLRHQGCARGRHSWHPSNRMHTLTDLSLLLLRWSDERHKYETCALNRRRFPPESASNHQKQKQEEKQDQNLKQSPCAIAMHLCCARWCGLGWPGLPAISIWHPIVDTGLWPTSRHRRQFNRPHHVTPARTNHPCCRRS